MEPIFVPKLRISFSWVCESSSCFRKSSSNMNLKNNKTLWWQNRLPITILIRWDIQRKRFQIVPIMGYYVVCSSVSWFNTRPTMCQYASWISWTRGLPRSREMSSLTAEIGSSLTPHSSAMDGRQYATHCHRGHMGDNNDGSAGTKESPGVDASAKLTSWSWTQSSSPVVTWSMPIKFQQILTYKRQWTERCFRRTWRIPSSLLDISFVESCCTDDFGGKVGP